MVLKFLGRGSAFNIKEENNSAYIKEDNALLLIDCGETVFKSIINKGLLDDIKEVHVLITHLDSDHVGSLSSLIYYCYFIKHIITKVYFPNEDLNQLLLLQGHTINIDYAYYIITEDRYNIRHIINYTIIFPIKTNHIKSLNCYGYIININNKYIYYSGDSNNISDIILENINDISEIYQDTCLADYEGNVHTSLRKLCNSIPKEYRNKVYCMHIDCDELIDKIASEGFNIVEVEK